MTRASIGELIYVPTGVRLVKIENEKIPIGHHTTKKPINLVVSEVTDYSLGVLYKGETWYVNKRDVYDS